MSTPVALLVAVILLAGNAFFVAAEFAVTSARRSQLEPLADEGDKRATQALWALENVSAMLATAQLGVTLCSTGLGVVAEPAVAHMLTGPLQVLGVGESGAHAIAVAVALALVVYMHVVAGEMVPKNLSISAPETAVRWLAPPLIALSRFFKPVITVLNGFATWVLARLGIETKDEVSATFTVQEVASIVERSTAEGVLDDDTGLLSGALEFSEENAGSVMVPLTELVTLHMGCTPEDVERTVATTGYSRFPLISHEDDGDPATTRISGYIHLKDVLDAREEERREAIPAWKARALVQVKVADEVEDVLASMQRTGAHVGQVVDEHGHIVGVVFLEDILEELVGEVNDAMQRHDARR